MREGAVDDLFRYYLGAVGLQPRPGPRCPECYPYDDCEQCRSGETLRRYISGIFDNRCSREIVSKMVQPLNARRSSATANRNGFIPPSHLYPRLAFLYWVSSHAGEHLCKVEWAFRPALVEAAAGMELSAHTDCRAIELSHRSTADQAVYIKSVHKIYASPANFGMRIVVAPRVTWMEFGCPVSGWGKMGCNYRGPLTPTWEGDLECHGELSKQDLLFISQHFLSLTDLDSLNVP